MKRKIIKKTSLAADLEVHVSTVTAAGETLVDIRQFIPSAKEYGRGITVPRSAVDDIANALDGA